MSRLALDLRPLQGGDSSRGIGTTVRGLARRFSATAGVVWRGQPLPKLAMGRSLTTVAGPNRRERVSWMVDAASSRLARLRSAETVWHLMSPDVSYDGGGRVVVTVNDAIPWRFPEMYPAGPTGRVRMALTARVARRADKVVVPSSVSASDVTELLGVDPANVEVIPWAADPDLEPPSADDIARVRCALGLPATYVVMAGGFLHEDPRKRYSDAVEAIAKLAGDVGLVVTGRDGPAARRLRGVIEGCGCADRVFMTGYLEVRDMAAVFGGASVFVFPSLWEGFGLPLLDAFSLGVPSVVSDGGSLPEVAAGAALVYPATDVSGLRERISEILESPSIARDLARRGRARASVYSWKAVAERYENVYSAMGVLA